MPKRKPDTVVSHRIELQETERDLLRVYVAGNTAGRVLNGVGAMIAPLAPVFGAAATAWLALYSATEIKDFLDEGVISSVRSEFADDQVRQYQEFSAYLQGRVWDDFRGTDFLTTWEEIHELQSKFHTEHPAAYTANQAASRPLRDRMMSFAINFNGSGSGSGSSSGETNIQLAITQGWGPAEAWSNYYPIEEAINDAIYTRGPIANSADFVMQIFGKGWLWDTEN